MILKDCDYSKFPAVLSAAVEVLKEISLGWQFKKENFIKVQFIKCTI